jgi:hypothetical protein
MKPHKSYIKAKRAFLAGKQCARCGSSGPLDPHHWAGCAGPLKMNFKLVVPMCRKCHDWAHQHMSAARADGFLCPLGCWNDEKKALQAQAACAIFHE